jgi:CheY-like chemotaxis protein
MNKIIEADFLPRETNPAFSWAGSIDGSGMKDTLRILIVDDDPDTTHLVKVLLERTGHYIFLTALVTRAEAKAGLQTQGHSFVAKPVSIPELINAI